MFGSSHYGLVALGLLLGWLLTGTVTAQNPSWALARESDSATVAILYTPNKPFVFEDEGDQMRGIEADLVAAFREFVKQEYGVSLAVEWQEVSGLRAIQSRLTIGSHYWGASGLSITSERQRYLEFTPPYMPDIEVLITHQRTGIFADSLSLIQALRVMHWVTVPNSTFERNLDRLKDRYAAGKLYRYVSEPRAVARAVAQDENGVGYVQLSNYIVAIQEDKPLNRQIFFQIQNEGLALALARQTDWHIPWKAFFARPQTTGFLNRLIRQYMGDQATELINQLSRTDTAQNRLEILEAERRIRDLQLTQKTLAVKQQRWVILTAGIGLLSALLIVFVLVRLNQSRKRAQQLLAQKNEELLRLNKEKNYLIGVVAHDLRNPLTSALSLAELSKEADTADEDRREIAAQLQKILGRMNDMVHRMLDIRSIEQAHTELEPETFRLDNMLEELVGERRESAEAKQIRLETELQEVTLTSDKTYWWQVAENLLSNAIKFSPEGSTVQLRLFRENPYKIRLEIEDEGPGVPLKDLPRLFLPYETLSARPTGGENSTGLGLSIVRRYVEALGGRVWCESQPDQRPGSTFVVTLLETEAV